MKFSDRKETPIRGHEVRNLRGNEGVRPLVAGRSDRLTFQSLLLSADRRIWRDSDDSELPSRSANFSIYSSNYAGYAIRRQLAVISFETRRSGRGFRRQNEFATYEALTSSTTPQPLLANFPFGEI